MKERTIYNSFLIEISNIENRHFREKIADNFDYYLKHFSCIIFSILDGNNELLSEIQKYKKKLTFLLIYLNEMKCENYDISDLENKWNNIKG